MKKSEIVFVLVVIACFATVFAVVRHPIMFSLPPSQQAPVGYQTVSNIEITVLKAIKEDYCWRLECIDNAGNCITLQQPLYPEEKRPRTRMYPQHTYAIDYRYSYNANFGIVSAIRSEVK